MDDLISRKAAIEVIDAIFPVDPTKSEYANGIAFGVALARTYVEQLPSAEPEIIRCKDCKHYKTHISCIGDEYSGCDYWINDGNESPCEPTDFCSYAERREE